MRQKIFLTVALLCIVAQGAWAQIPDPTVYDDVWDGHSTSKPEYYEGLEDYNPAYEGYNDVYLIKKASELAYVRDHFKSFDRSSLLLLANLDMGVVSWIPMGNNKGDITTYWGTFYGNGHTITATITDNNNQCTALFSYINGATIKNLKVAGTINSNQYHAATIVGFSKGTGNSIVNCAATANVNGNEYVGGILGHAVDSDISMSGCTFSGLMTGGSKFLGAFIGWGDSGTRKITDCLYIMQDGQDTRNLELVKNGGNLSITNCYKTTSALMPSAQASS